MKITEAQQAELLSKIGKYFESLKCIVCGKDAWQMDPVVFQLTEFRGVGLQVASGTVKPLIAIMCANCGNTITMSAVVAGAIPPQEQIDPQVKAGPTGLASALGKLAATIPPPVKAGPTGLASALGKLAATIPPPVKAGLIIPHKKEDTKGGLHE